MQASGPRLVPAPDRGCLGALVAGDGGGVVVVLLGQVGEQVGNVVVAGV
jgi:hypothetical protein